MEDKKASNGRNDDLEKAEAELLLSGEKESFLDGLGDVLSETATSGGGFDPTAVRKNFIDYAKNPKSWIGLLVVTIVMLAFLDFLYFLFTIGMGGVK